MHRALATAAALLALAASALFAGDDPSIQGELREGIQQAMHKFVEDMSVDGKLRHYDPVSGELLTLELQELHAGIVKKGDFYVSCADFSAENERTVDIEFLVLVRDGELFVSQALVHKVDGEKRPYHLEEEEE